MKLNDILNEGLVRDYYMADWKHKLGIPEEVIELYGQTGYDQRGTPENRMLRVQNAIGGGVLSGMVEHVGDLSNRASPMHNYDWGREESGNKAERCLRVLRSGYGFEREHEENMASNIKHQNADETAYKMKLNNALREYAHAHKQLKVYNKVQELARDAAVALGEKRFNDSADLLEKFLTIANDEDVYAAAMKAYYKNPA